MQRNAFRLHLASAAQRLSLRLSLRLAPRLGLVILACAALVALAPAVKAQQQLQHIVAVVNDEVISAHDMQTRLDLVIRSANLPDTQETRDELSPQVLRSLIDERLQMQEARRRGIEVSDEEVQAALANLERNNNMQPGQLDAFLAERGIDKDAVIAQVTAELAWGTLLRQQVLPRVQISDGQVQNEIQRWRALEGQAEYHIAEILLIPDTQDDFERAGEVARNLVEDMREGARFSVTAQQFSQGPTAAAGGDIGWVDADSLIEEVRSIVERMPVGAVTDPIRIPGGWTIVFLRDKRVIGSTGPENATYTLSQIVWPAPPEMAAAQRAEIMRRAEDARAQVGGCEDVERVGEATDAVEAGPVGQVRLTDLPAEFHSAIADLESGDVAAPVDNGRAVVVLVVCDRTQRHDVRLDPEQVRQRLANDRIGLQARRYLRDLRRDALIEIRN